MDQQPLFGRTSRNGSDLHLDSLGFTEDQVREFEELADAGLSGLAEGSNLLSVERLDTDTGLDQLPDSAIAELADEVSRQKRLIDALIDAAYPPAEVSAP